uniref:Uncharacterized protein n=1 Tax=Acrobeloides nanus TaxID=290746 RepID=A0A914C7A1_9BILA
MKRADGIFLNVIQFFNPGDFSFYMAYTYFSIILVLLPTAFIQVYGSNTSLSLEETALKRSEDDIPLIRLTRDILSPQRYDTRVRPASDHKKPLKIYITMSLYQIIDVNEPAQNIKMNVWMIQRWADEMLDWNPAEYAMINTTILPHSVLWLPDTYVYNSVVMNADETERYMNIRADSRHWEGKRGSNMSFLYPAIYTVTCRLNIRYFPYDQQNCTLTIGSWTSDSSALDYYADENVNLASYIANEEWNVISFKIYRHEYLYACCPEPWVILEASLILRRKPLYYVVNLIIPTSIITIVAITGFFTPASTSDDRTEKINLGITTLLAMSILMLMVSDQMPTTSEFVPLIAWFYLAIIILISVGTFLTSVILSIQGRRQYGKLPPLKIRYWFFTKIIHLVGLSVPPNLLQLWEELDDHPLISFSRNLDAEKAKKKDNKGQKEPLKREKSKEMPQQDNNHNVLTEKPPEYNLLTPSAPPMNLSPTPAASTPGQLSRQSSTRAKSNWLKVGAAATKPIDDKNSLPMIDMSLPTSPASIVPASRKGSATIWDNAMSVAGVQKPAPRGSKQFSLKGAAGEVSNMKVKRQCSLEWEFIATILDRIFLIVFSLAVAIVTAGIIVTGHIAQQYYEQFAREMSGGQEPPKNS